MKKHLLGMTKGNMQEHYLNNKLYYRKNDFKSDRPTFVFVHGLSGSSSAWKQYVEKYSSSYNVLTLDLRGHGKSWKPLGENEYAIEKFSDDLLELINFLKIEKFILIAHSFAVLIALEFLSAHSERVERAILLSSNFAPKKLMGAKIVKPFLKFTPLLKLFPQSEAGKTHIDYAKYLHSGDWNISRMIADIRNTSLRVYLYGTIKSYEVNYESILEKINIPVLLVHGDKDSIFPLAGARYMHSKIKNSQLKIIENSNHILVLNNFSEVSDAIEDFISPPSS